MTVFAQRIRSFAVKAAAASNTAIKGATATSDDGTTTLEADDITQPDVARNITATAGGTAGDIAAAAVEVSGRDIKGRRITETLPAFTADTAATKVGSKAFASIDEIVLPEMDGDGATIAIGTGSKLGIPDRLERDSVVNVFMNNVREGTRPTVAVDEAAVAGNTVTPNTALGGQKVVIDYYRTPLDGSVGL